MCGCGTAWEPAWLRPLPVHDGLRYPLTCDQDVSGAVSHTSSGRDASRRWTLDQVASTWLSRPKLYGLAQSGEIPCSMVAGR